ncbi:MAG TPA: hypothetical protein VMW75_10045 [Thermoanaerobaculia bacterium]|nr:hypothetical protein [Thermoanaerobaculia bacterium]
MAIVLIAAALGLNVGSNLLIPLFNGLLFLDMLGTAMVALAVGPWWAALVGLSTNLILGPMRGHAEYPDFAIVNVYGAIVWGLAAHGRLAPFRETVKPGAFLGKLLVLGVLGGTFCAAVATYTRADFGATLAQATVDRLPQTHAAERLLKDAVNCHYWGLRAGDPTYDFILLDVFTIIPDKVISIAFAAFVLFNFPWFASRPAAEPPRLATQWRSALLFALAFAYFARKQLSSWWDNPWQAVVWWIPEVLAVAAAFLRPHRIYAVSRGAPIQGGKLEVDDAYKNILGIVALCYSLTVAWSLAQAPAPSASSAARPCPQVTSTNLSTPAQPCSEATLPANLARDGIGIFSFLTIFGFGPLTLRKYLRSGSEQAWRDGHEAPRPPGEPAETERQGAP